MDTLEGQKHRVIGKKYKLGESVGKGASGTVYKALDQDTGVIVAIKELSLKSMTPPQLEAIMSEIDLLKTLKHPKIVKYLDFLRTKDHLFIMLEFVESGSLAHMVRKFGAMQERLVAFYMRQVLEGLVYLHEQGVLHRDIKGANILSTKDADIKLADFGVATKLRDAGNLSISVVGTPYWMAPEVIEMNGATAASDIWSLGCTAIELLTGKPPYYSLPPMTAMFQIVHDPHPPLPEGISPVMKDFLIQCFQKDAAQRVSARQLLRHPLLQSLRAQSYHDVLATLRSQDSLQKKGTRKRLADIYDWREEPSTGSVNGGNSTGNDMNNGSGTVPRRAGEKNDSLNRALSPTDVYVKLDGSGTGAGGSVGHAKTRGLSRDSAGSLGSSFGQGLDLSSTDEGTPLQSPRERGVSNVTGAASPITTMVPGSSATTSTTGAGGNTGIGHSSTVQHQSVANRLDAYAENEDDDLGLSFEDNHEAHGGLELRAGVHPVQGVQTGMSSDLSRTPAMPRSSSALVTTSQVDRVGDTEIFDDPFGDEFATEVDPRIEQDASRKRLQSEEVLRYISHLNPQEEEETVLNACRRLALLFKENPDQRSFLIQHHGVMAIMDMLEVQSPNVLHAVLEVVNEIIRDNPEFQENLCLVGSIPVIMKFAGPESNKKVRGEAAKFLRSMCHTSRITLQMFIACRGLPVLVGWLEPAYSDYRTLVHMGIAGILRVFDLQSPTPKNDFCRLFAKSKLAPRLMKTLHNILSSLDVENEIYLDRIANILLHCCNADVIVKGYFAQEDVLSDLFASILLAQKVFPSVVLKLLKAVRILSADHQTLENLQAAQAIPALVPFLNPEGDFVNASEVHSQAMSSLFHLCRIKRQRQEEAAVHGAIPYLVHFVRVNSPLRQFALPILCDMAHATNQTRDELWKNNCAEFYLELLDQEYWQEKALDALAQWLANDRERRVEGVLCRPGSLEKITGAVTTATDSGFLKLLEPLEAMISNSTKVNQVLGSSGFLHNLIKRLDHPDALARLSLLKILRSFYEYSREPKRMIAEYKLFQVVDGIVTNDTTSVLVRGVAEQLKRAFDANVLL